ncbi:MAG TPA: alpha/beta fold hydrolase [Verrucomicrobiae bacterium]|nr:alpha/beta fold hydrolase [Verrucomicrobiae bacterium]
MTWVLCIGAVALVGTVVVARHYLKWLPRSIVYVPNTDKTINPADDPPIERLAELGVSQQLRVDVGPPAASLCVWIVDPPTSHPIAGKRLRGTILVLHGIQANKDPMLGVGRKLAAAGYRGILVDSRGHGRSSGQWATYGVLESHDLSQLLDTLNRQGLLASPVGAYGVSYGAATAILLAGIDPRVRAVVAVAPFATMRDEVHHYIRRFVPSLLITNAQIDKSIDAAGRLANFDPQAASPLWAIGETKAQVLLIHGKADRKISCQQSEALHAAAPDHSELVLVDGEDHDSILTDPASPVVADMLKWFDHWL